MERDYDEGDRGSRSKREDIIVLRDGREFSIRHILEAYYKKGSREPFILEALKKLLCKEDFKEETAIRILDPNSSIKKDRSKGINEKVLFDVNSSIEPHAIISVSHS